MPSARRRAVRPGTQTLNGRRAVSNGTGFAESSRKQQICYVEKQTDLLTAEPLADTLLLLDSSSIVFAAGQSPGVLSLPLHAPRNTILYASLIRASQSWRRVVINEFER